MKTYPVPVQFAGEEKIFGGMLTLRQCCWLFLFTGLGLAGASLLPVSIVFRVVIFVVCAACGVALAFLPIAGVSLDIYLHRLYKFGKRDTKLSLR